jgi:hypothetical protein
MPIGSRDRLVGVAHLMPRSKSPIAGISSRSLSATRPRSTFAYARIRAATHRRDRSCGARQSPQGRALGARLDEVGGRCRKQPHASDSLHEIAVESWAPQRLTRFLNSWRALGCPREQASRHALCFLEPRVLRGPRADQPSPVFRGIYVGSTGWTSNRHALGVAQLAHRGLRRKEGFPCS